MRLFKVPITFITDMYGEYYFSYTDKPVYITVAEEINQYGEIDHVSTLSPEAATETRNMR